VTSAIFPSKWFKAFLRPQVDSASPLVSHGLAIRDSEINANQIVRRHTESQVSALFLCEL
jgi:hypothetical protein